MRKMSTTNEIDRLKKQMTLRQILPQDLSAVASVHLDSFPDSALSRLGSMTVERYYRWQLEGPHKKVRAFGVFLDGRCIGYSFSGQFSGSTSGFLKRNRGYLVGRVLARPWLLLNPLFFDRFKSGLKLLTSSHRKKQRRASKSVQEKSYGILSIAVASKFQKYGIGKIMMADAEREALEAEFTQMHLTVSPKNDKAINFYERLGWIKKEENGDWRGLMIKRLSGAARPALHGE